MSATAEGRRPLWRSELGELELWYPTFEVFAASTPAGSPHFHGPHVAVPVALPRVLDGLQWLEEHHRTELDATPLPTLEQMRAELASRRRPQTDAGTLHSGSPCHNLWHWLHGN